MTTTAKRALVLTSAIATSFLAAACAASSAAQAQDPLSCGLIAEPSGRTTLYEAQVSAETDSVGSYMLTFRTSQNGNRTSLTQGGSFELEAGEIAVLSRNYVSVDKSAVDYELSLIINGQSYECPGTDDFLTFAPATA